MKVDAATLQYIDGVITTCLLVGIDSVIIEPSMVRGLHEDGTVAILHTTKVPDMPFRSIGISSGSMFASRYEMVKTGKDITVDASTAGADGAQYAKALTMRSGALKIEYRCANPATIRAPRELNHTLKYTAVMTPEAVARVQRGAAAMQTDELTLIGSKEDVTLEMSDVNGDRLTYGLGTPPTNITPDDDTDPVFSFRYPTKLLQTVFKPNANALFTISNKGMLKVTVNGLDVYIRPRAG